MHRRTKILVKVVIVVALVLVTLLQLRYVLEDSHGLLWWNSDQAYLFLGAGCRGYHMSYLLFPWEAIKGYLNVPTFPDDRHVAMTVIRVTQDGMERHVLDFGDDPTNTPQFLTPLDHDIYAMCKGAVLCKWTGTRFDRVDEEEEQRLGGVKRLVSVRTEKHIDGWSRLEIGPSLSDQFTARVGQKFSLLVKNEVTDSSESKAVSIYLQRTGQAPESIWHVDLQSRRVSRVQYEQCLERR